MKVFANKISLICTLFFFFSCTFDYDMKIPEDFESYELRLVQAKTQRFENGEISFELNADIIDMYKKNNLWIANEVDFIKFKQDLDKTIESKGETTILYVDENKETYYFGVKTKINIIDEELIITTEDLKYDQKNNVLSSPKNAIVNIIKDDGTTISGKGFSANLLNYQYNFSGSVYGTFVNKSEATEGIE